MFISPIGAVGNSASKILGVRRNQPEQTSQTNPIQPVTDSVSFKGGNYAEVFETQFNRELRNCNSVKDVFNKLIAAIAEENSSFLKDSEETLQKTCFKRMMGGGFAIMDATMYWLRSRGADEIGSAVAAIAKEATEHGDGEFPMMWNKEGRLLFGIKNHGKYGGAIGNDRECIELCFHDSDLCTRKETGNEKYLRKISIASDSDNDYVISKQVYSESNPEIPAIEMSECYYNSLNGGKIKDRSYWENGKELCRENFYPDGRPISETQKALDDLVDGMLDGINYIGRRIKNLFNKP